MVQILIKVPEISSEAYTSLGSSSRFVIRLAAGCCFVLRTLMSLLLSVNRATSAPEMMKVSSNNTPSVILSTIIFPCGLAASSEI